LFTQQSLRFGCYQSIKCLYYECRNPIIFFKSQSKKSIKIYSANYLYYFISYFTVCIKISGCTSYYRCLHPFICNKKQDFESLGKYNFTTEKHPPTSSLLF